MKGILYFVFVFILLAAAPIFADLDVRWIHDASCGDFTKHCYNIEVENLDKANVGMDLSSLISEASFDIDNMPEMKFYQYDEQNVLKHYENTTCTNAITPNGTQYQKCVSNPYDQEETVFVWEESKNKFFDRSTQNVYKESMGVINIGRFETKLFRLEYYTPLADIGYGFGSYGKASIEINDIEYHPYWNESWIKRQQITLNNTVGSTLTDFPALLKIDYVDGMQSDYDDLRFINGTCGNGDTELSYEIDWYNSTEVDIWIKLPEFTYPQTSICMYFNNTDAGSGQDRVNVWDHNYVAVYHMNLTGSDNLMDSTSNDFTAIKGAGSPVEYDPNGCSVGNCVSLSSVYFSVADNSVLDMQTNQLTIEYWSNYTSTVTNNIITAVTKPNGAGYPAYSTGIQNDGGVKYTKMYLNNYNPITTVDDGSIAGAWDYRVVTYDQIFMHTYRNMVNNSERDNTNAIANTGDPLNIGQWRTGDAKYWVGSLDEIRLSNITRSIEWLNMSYDIVAYNDQLVTFGSVEEFVVVPHLLNATFISPTPLNDSSVSFTENFTIRVSYESTDNITSVALEWDGANYTKYPSVSDTYVDFNSSELIYGAGLSYEYLSFINAGSYQNVTETRTITIVVAGGGTCDVDELSDAVIEKMLRNARILNDRMVNFHNHAYCISNTTIRSNATYEYCIGSSDCKIMSDIMDRECTYGCDQERDVCVPSPAERLGLMIAFVIVMIVIAYITLNYLGSTEAYIAALFVACVFVLVFFNAFYLDDMSKYVVIISILFYIAEVVNRMINESGDNAKN